MKRGFTLIELLVIVSILAVMVAIGVGSIRAGQGAARVKSATRDIYAAIRHARSIALVTGQPAIITYSTEEADGESIAKVEVTTAKLFNNDNAKRAIQTLSGEPLKNKGRELVHIEKEGGDAIDGTKKGDEGGGETVEDILFAPINAETVTGMRLKVQTEDELAKETEGRKSRISVFSNVDYLIGRFKKSRAEKEKSDKPSDQTKNGNEAAGLPEAERQEPVSIVWETNGRVDPHQVWVYVDGQKPEDGLLIKIDRFGAAKVVSGDGRDEDD